MSSQFKSEVPISKVTLLSRKIASLAVGRIPKEHISPGGESSNKKTRVLTNHVSEAIYDIIDAHHDEIMEYIAEALIRSNTLEVTYKAVVLSRNGEIELTVERLSEYMKAVLRKWRNVPYRSVEKRSKNA